MAVLRRELPRLLERLGKIPDLRNPRRCRHKLTVLLLYGLLMFVFQFASRREVNLEMTRAQFKANLRLLFPELETLPHADTLFRLLRDIDVQSIEQAHIELVGRLIRGKKFRRYLINNCYPVAIDGSQKFARDTLLDENLLQRTQGKEEKRHTQYFVYILEASLVFHNGMVIPLLSEFLEYAKGDTDNNKQDCEQRAFHRLSERLMQLFPRLPLLLLLDGLYANGPVMRLCRQLNRQFMIVLKDKDLPSAWEEFESLQPPQGTLRRAWRARHHRLHPPILRRPLAGSRTGPRLAQPTFPTPARIGPAYPPAEMTAAKGRTPFLAPPSFKHSFQFALQASLPPFSGRRPAAFLARRLFSPLHVLGLPRGSGSCFTAAFSNTERWFAS